MIRKLWRYIKPESLKSKLFLSFFIIILIPLFLLQVRNQSQLKNTFVDNTSFQNLQQLSLLKSTLLDVRSKIFQASFGWEQDSAAIMALRHSDQPSARAQAIEAFSNRIKLIREDSLVYEEWIQGELFDASGTCLFMMRQDQTAPACTDSLELSTARLLQWNVVNIDGQDNLVYLNSLQTEDGNLAGFYRIRFVFEGWFATLSSSVGALQNFAVIQDGRVLAETKPYFPISNALQLQIANGELSTVEPHLDADASVLINFIYDPLLQWHIVSQFPMGLFLGDMQQLQTNAMLQLLLFSGFFTLITYLILQRVTRPLALLQRKMGQLIDKEFKVRLDERGLDGEVLFLARTFNTMTRNIDLLIERLKTQERQKEAAQFQLLLSQMNPHLLLNTLNTMKWMALSRQQQEIADICIHLGLLLEASLKTDVDLVLMKAELELAHSFLRLQQYRYLDKISYEVVVDPEVEYALVPKFSLQPLVENAISHGIIPKEGMGNIVISARREGQTLLLHVTDNGIGMQESAKLQVLRKRKGIGLRNLQERLELLFKREAGLVAQSSDDGTQIVISMPLLLSTPYRREGD
jgi:two-component system sensor histidine kinase YesM